MTLSFAEKSRAAAGESESEGLPPDAARGWVGAEIEITKAVLIAMYG